MQLELCDEHDEAEMSGYRVNCSMYDQPLPLLGGLAIV